MSLCEATFTSSTLEIRPLCPPISRIPSFTQARRRVYLTATLADDSVLVSALDADPKTISTPIAPGRASDIGDRLILAPLELNPKHADIAGRELAAQLATEHNVVVLVPSDRAAKNWEPYGAKVTPVKQLGDTVRRLKAGEHLGLVVLANKYDGIDLPHQACRVLVIDGLPRAAGPGERRDAAVLRGSPLLAGRQVQLIEQGMGRGVRDATDHCVVLLLGDDLTATVSLRANRVLFSPATWAQLELSRQVADQIQDEGFDAVRTAAKVCLDRDPDWTAAAREALDGIVYAERQEPRASAVAQRMAFNLAAIGQYDQAADVLGAAANAAASDGDRALAGLLFERQALYLDHVNQVDALAVQRRALEHNDLLLRPPGAAVRPIRPVMAQGEAATRFLADKYQAGMQLVLGVKEMLDRISWDPERTDDAEAAVKELGQHLGFVSTRPDSEYGVGPDNLWALSSRHFVIELKTGRSANTICKDDVDQLGGSLRWHEQEVVTDAPITPVLMHRSCEHDANGTPPPGTRVIDEVRLAFLKEAVVAWATGLAEGVGRWKDPARVAELLKQHKLDVGTLLNTFTTPARKVR
jgi:hypothetical protein